MKKHPNLKNVFVSDCGKVWESLDEKSRGICYPQCILANVHEDVYGYEIVTFRTQTLRVNKFFNRKKFKVHQLVAQTYMPNPESKTMIDHINHIKTDNRVTNLRWVTRAENNADKKARSAKEYKYSTIYNCFVDFLFGFSRKQISEKYNVTTNSLGNWFRCSTRTDVLIDVLRDYRNGKLQHGVVDNRVEYILQRMETVGLSDPMFTQ